MPFNGSGTFTRVYNWATDAAGNIPITASRVDTEDTGFATGLSSVICKDGQTTTTAQIPFAAGIKTWDGTVASPAIAFTSEQGSGLYRVGAGEVGLAVTGTQVVDYKTGTVTINPNTASTTSSTGALVVTGGLGVGGAVNIGGNVTVTGNLTVSGTALFALRGYISGLTLSAAGASSTFSVAAGIATSDDVSVSMPLAASISKTTSSWTVGSGNGALDTGAIAPSTWYHVYLIERTDTSVVDVLVSLSASAPTLPASYTKKRRIGAMKTDGASQWVAFSQLGDEFLWGTAIQDANNVAIADTLAHLLTVSVPSGVQVNALMAWLTQASGGGANSLGHINSPDESDQAFANGFYNVGLSTNTSSGFQSAEDLHIRTNTSAQVRYRYISAGGTFYVNTRGWIDTRGRFA